MAGVILTAVPGRIGLSVAGGGGRFESGTGTSDTLVLLVSALGANVTVAVPIPRAADSPPPAGPIVRVLGSLLLDPLHPAIEAIASAMAAPIIVFRSIVCPPCYSPHNLEFRGWPP